ncbi:MAG: transporter, partial [Deltaproteobacteria bacterium]|nr:transporter [Deltaproteobacteria bacterium]
MQANLKMLSCALALACAIPLASSAQTVTASGDLQRFQPAGVPYTGFSAASGDLIAPGDAVVGFHLDYARNPLVYIVDGQRQASTVANNLTLHLHWAMGLHERFELSVGVPITLFQNGDDPRVSDLAEQAVGDVRIRPRIQILRQWQNGIGLTFSPTITIPVSKKNAFSSEGSVRFLPELGASWRGEKWFFSGDVLFRWRNENTPVPKATLGSELELLLSVGRIVSKDVELIGELNGGISFATLSEGAKGNPLEGLFGVRWRSGESWTYHLLGGVGILGAAGVPDCRVVWGVMYGTGRPRPNGTC